MQCRGIGPHLVARGKSHRFSRVAAGTWGIFSSYDGLLELVSTIQQSDSAIRVHIVSSFLISFPFRSPQSTVEFPVLNSRFS